MSSYLAATINRLPWSLPTRKHKSLVIVVLQHKTLDDLNILGEEPANSLASPLPGQLSSHDPAPILLRSPVDVR